MDVNIITQIWFERKGKDIHTPIKKLKINKNNKIDITYMPPKPFLPKRVY